MRGGKDISVRKRGSVVNIRVFDCYNDRVKVFEGEARVNNVKEMDQLLSTLEAKGFLSKGGWW